MRRLSLNGMSYEDLLATIERLSPPAQRHRPRRNKVLVVLSDEERGALAEIAAHLGRPLAEVVRGLALVAAHDVREG